jgi:hypothetical protein
MVGVDEPPNEPAEMVGMQVGNENCRHAIGIEPELVEAD